MTKSIINITKFFLMLGLSWISFIGISQDLNSNKKEKKELRKAERLKDYEALGTLLESRKFVFEANLRQSKGGSVVTINPKINYIIVDSMSFTTTIFGLKPYDGVMTRWVLLKNDKKLSYSIKFYMHILSLVTSDYEIYMDVYANQNAKVKMKRSLGITYTGINETLYYGQIKTI